MAVSGPGPGLAQLAPGRAATAPVRFTPEYLRDPKNVEQGREVWRARCQFCHGKVAYPGKAPKLDPSRYTPEFVYDRVANGFRAMPGWRQEFSEQELRAVVAWVLSKDFSN
jgi:mono/diheme cytochrome c family protein